MNVIVGGAEGDFKRYSAKELLPDYFSMKGESEG
jgi:hypothetical protein